MLMMVLFDVSFLSGVGFYYFLQYKPLTSIVHLWQSDLHLNNRNPRVNKMAFEQKSVCFNKLSKKAHPELVWFSITLSLKGIPLFMSSAHFEVPRDLDITRRIDLFESPKCKILTKKLSDDSMHKTRNLLAAWLIFPSLLHAIYIFFLRKAHTEILKFFYWLL